MKNYKLKIKKEETGPGSSVHPIWRVLIAGGLVLIAVVCFGAYMPTPGPIFSVPYNSNGVSSGSSGFVFTNGNVGIGTATPTSGRLVIDGGHLTFGTDNTYDIGASGANRPRNLYLRGTGTFSGGVTGASPTPRITFEDYYDSAGNPSVSHINLYGGLAGFGFSGSGLEYFASAGSAHRFWSDTSTLLMTIASPGNLLLPGTIRATNGIASYATNIVASANAAGWTNTVGINMAANIIGTSGSYVFYNRSGVGGSTVCGTSLFTNGVTATGNTMSVPVNCGIQVVTGVGVTIVTYAQ